MVVPLPGNQITAFHSWSERWRKFSTICWFIFHWNSIYQISPVCFCNNLKSIGVDCYYTLTEKYAFPLIDTFAQTEQNWVFKSLNDRGEPVTPASDGCCDSPGHSATYVTYTMLDVKSNKIVDFKVVSVCNVKNSNAMEKKGFTRTLSTVEEAGVDVAGVSTDSHPQIIEYMREEQKDK